jgi:hypothetical protein
MPAGWIDAWCMFFLDEAQVGACLVLMFVKRNCGATKVSMRHAVFQRQPRRPLNACRRHVATLPSRSGRPPLA